jgi:hypothetical protein
MCLALSLIGINDHLMVEGRYFNGGLSWKAKVAKFAEDQGITIRFLCPVIL